MSWSKIKTIMNDKIECFLLADKTWVVKLGEIEFKSSTLFKALEGLFKRIDFYLSKNMTPPKAITMVKNLWKCDYNIQEKIAEETFRSSSRHQLSTSVTCEVK